MFSLFTFSSRSFRTALLIFILTAFGISFLISPTSGAHAAGVITSWSPNPEPNIAGYKVYFGTSSRNYQFYIDAGKNTTYTISNIEAGKTYYFCVTAYNTSGKEGAYSTESMYTVPSVRTYSISPTSQSFGASGGVGVVNVTASVGCAWLAVTNNSWLILNSVSTSTGNGTVNYTVSPNPDSASRTGTLTIAGKTFTVTQAGATNYTLTINKAGTGNGNVISNPSGSSYSAGTVVTLTATPDVNSTFSGWAGECTGTSPTCSVTMNASKTVTATFANKNLKTYTITASDGAFGSMVPTGAVNVNEGGSQTFNIYPMNGYKVDYVLVDGKSVGAVTSYTFANVTANHTIYASFIQNDTYTLTVTKAGQGSGTITSNPSGTTFKAGTTVTLTAVPDTSSTFTGWSGGCTGTSSACTIALKANTTVTATFNSKTITITAKAGENGAINPQGSIIVNYGGNRTFSITPNLGFRVADLKVDGASQGTLGSYTFTNLTSNHTIEASFAPSSAGNQPVFAVNCGGPQYVDKAGIIYQADTRFVGGNTSKTTVAIEGTEDDLLYQSERYGYFSYNIPVANGNYSVILKFAEIYAYISLNKRVFDVKIEGKEVISNLDLYAKVGKYRAYDVSIPVTVTDGMLNIDFRADVGSAKVNAILVTKR